MFNFITNDLSFSDIFKERCQPKKNKNVYVSAFFNTSAEAYMLTASTSEALTMRTCTIDLFVFQVVRFGGIGDMESQ